MADDVTSTVKVEADAEGAKAEVSSLQGSFGNLFAAIAGGVTVGGLAVKAIDGIFSAIGSLASGVKNFVGGSIQMNSTLETSRLQFETLMGNADKAREHVAFLFDFAKRTPFETGPIIQASKTLQTFGGDALNSQKNLTLFGDAAAATSAPIQEVSMWSGRLYAQLQAGKPFGEAAQRLGELAVMTPKTRMELESMQKSGASGAQIWEKYQESLDRFTGAMDKQSHTWEGLTSSISDSINLMSGKIFQPFFDMAKAGMERILDLLSDKGVNGAVDRFAYAAGQAFQIVGHALSPLIDAVFGATKQFAALADTQTAGEKVTRFIVNALATVIDTFASIVRAGAAVIIGWNNIRIAGDTMARAIMSFIANVLEGYQTMLSVMAKVTPGEAGKRFAQDADAVGKAVGTMRARVVEADADIARLSEQNKTVSATSEKFAGALNKAATEARNTKIQTADLAVATKDTTKEVANFGDEANKTGGKLTGVAKKIGDWAKAEAELDAEIQMAMKNGVPMNQIIEMFGKKAEESAAKGRVFGKDVSAAVQMVADTMEARDIGLIMQKQVEKWGKETDKLNKTTEDALHKHTDMLGKDMIEAAKIYSEFEDKSTAASLTGTDKRLYDIERERKARLAQITGIGGIFDAARKEINDFYDHEVELAEGTADTIVERMQKAGVQTQADREEQVANFKRDYEQMKESGQFTTQELYAAWKKWHDSAKQLDGDFSTSFLGTLDTIAAGFQQLAQIAGSSFSDTAKFIGTAISTMKVGVQSAEGFTDTLSGMKEGTVSTGAGIAALASNTMGMIGSMQQATDHATRTSNALHGMAQGAAIGTAIMPGWGTAVGAAVGLVWGAVKGVPNWAKLTNEIQRDFEANISKPLADKIAETAKDVGDRSTATMMHLSDILKDIGGITMGNFETWTQKTHDLFSFIERGQIGVGEASKQLNEIFPQLAKTLLSSNQIASQSFLDLIELDKKFGTNSQAVAEFVAAESNKLIHGLSGILGSFAKDTEALVKQSATMSADDIATATGDMQTRFDRLSRVTLTTFNTMIAQGHSSAEAIDALAGPMGALIKSHDDLHLAGNGAYDELARLHTLISNNKPLLESMAGTNEMMVALGNLGSKDQQAFADLRAEGLNTFKQMTAAGFTQQEAEQQMKPLLESIIKLHDERGIAIDDETQAMINQAREDGVLRDQEQSTNSILQQGLGAIIKAVGGDLPAAWKKAADASDDMKNRGTNAAGTVAGALAGQTNQQVDILAGKLQGTPWESYKFRADVAAQDAANQLANVGNTAEATGRRVYNSSGYFDSWADRAAGAARDVQGAIDGVNFGSSPGGIKEFAPMLRDATEHFERFGRRASSQLRQVKSDVNAMSGIHGARLDTSLTMGVGARGGGGTVINVNADFTKAVITNERDRKELALQLGQVIADEHFKGAKVQVTKSS
jgi:hypothetical protein